jgi:hypothetical protein
MIAAYQHKNKEWVFLDATGKKADINLFTSFIQGKQAMIGISADSFLLATVPIKDTSVNKTVDAIEISIKDKIVVGNGTATLYGYDALNYNYRNSRKNKEEQQDYFKAYFAKGSNKVSFKDVEFTMPPRENISIKYQFELPDYSKFHENELYINLNMDKDLIPEKIIDGRDVPVAMHHITKKTLMVTFNVPSDYKIDFIPQDMKAGNNIVGYSSTYQVKNNKIVHICEFYINTLVLKPEHFNDYNKIVTEQIKAFNQTVSLIKK